MSREDAINNLNMISVAFVEAETKEQRKIIDDTFDMAIKALEQEPCEDAISRQAVQDYIAKYLSQYLYNDVREAVEVIDEYIGELPSVKPQEPILDKIRAEIMQLYNEVEVVDYDHNDISRIKKAHWIIREEVLLIIDKYNSHPKRGADMRESEE